MGYITLSILLSCAAYAKIFWPPDTTYCSRCHRDSVLTVPGCPGNTEVRVSRAGGGGTISFQEFLNQVGTQDNRTYIIEKSDQPYIWGCRQVNIGGWSAGSKRTCIVIRGATGIREDVVLAGADPGVDPTFWHSSEYGGSSSCGIGQVLQIVNAENIVIADLTMRNFAGKMIKIDGGSDWYPQNIRMHNLDLWDCGSQMIKVAGEPVSSWKGVLECSFLHYTDGLFAECTYETQGIDVHEGKNWVIKDNHFLNFRQRQVRVPGAGLGSAILMWDYTDTVWAERNLIINCNFAVKFAATWYDDGSDLMTAVNNLVIYDDPDPVWFGDDVFSVGNSVVNGGIFHNTVWNPHQTDGTALSVCSNDYPIRNNLYLKGTNHRCTGAGDNVQIADSTWFKDVSAYDFHLTANRTVPQTGLVTEDIEGIIRDNPPSVGAYEFRAQNIQGTFRPEESKVIIEVKRFTDCLLIKCNGIKEPINVVITDLTGQLAALFKGSGPVLWPTKNRMPGIYFIRVGLDQSVLIRKVLLF